jgi:hypothetical protein
VVFVEGLRFGANLLAEALIFVVGCASNYHSQEREGIVFLSARVRAVILRFRRRSGFRGCIAINRHLLVGSVVVDRHTQGVHLMVLSDGVFRSGVQAAFPGGSCLPRGELQGGVTEMAQVM